jgi:phosphohistidine swiveling domain-containing protein
MSIVIMVLLSLISVGIYSSKGIGDWKLGRTAGETLRAVHTAQRMFLADNPTVLVANITAANVISYLPNSATTMPTVKSLTGATLTILVDQFPPVVNNGSGVRYDPSGSTTDSLWDVGE